MTDPAWYRVTFIDRKGQAGTVRVHAHDRASATQLGFDKIDKMRPGVWVAEDHTMTRRETSRANNNGGTKHA
jgi:hypothetical protein